jgi:tetratricopeptide (TPR) repeat protein
MKSSRRYTLGIFLVGALLWTAAFMPRIAVAQLGAPSREYPGPDYYRAMFEYQDGEFRSALREFQFAGKSGIRTTEGRWVDSICYHTMAGECLFQMGELGRALEQYTHALNLLVAHRHWMLRVEFQNPTQDDRSSRRPLTWGASRRGTRLGRFPTKYPILQGRPDNERVIQQGGVFVLPEYHLINAHEIARCSAVAIRRRHQIMGIACRYDPLTTLVLNSLSPRPASPHHWSQSWISVQLGMAYAAAGKGETAIGELRRGLQVLEAFDHPLTPVTLLQLGQLSFQQKQFANASRFFFEATISGALFEQYDVMEEAFRGGVLTHIITGQKGLYPPLAGAIEWSQRESRWLEVSLLLAAAQNAAELNESGTAAGFVDQARRRTGRREILAGAVGARLQYTAALINYQRGNLKAGDADFALLLAYQTKSSFRLFEIGLVDRLYTNGIVTDRVADELYGSALREPGPADWAVDPVETLSVILTPHLPALENWFEAALKRKAPEHAIEIADRIRRHRFYTTLPMGGRLLALRWVLEAPREAIGAQAVLQRQDLMDSYPRYAALSKQAAAIKKVLKAGPLIPDDDAARRAQTQKLAELSNVSMAQEVLLREMALRRTPSEFVFPPQLNFKKLQMGLPEGQLVLSFLITSRGAYAFLFGKSSYASWQLESPVKVRAQISALLRAMGHLDGNQAIDLDKFADPAWKGISQEILKRLTNNSPASVWNKFDELVVVPDGPLWYVPFEALQIEDGTETVPMISKVRLRYVPTVSLALPDARRTGPAAETAVVAGALFPRAAPEISQAAVADLAAGMSRVTRLTDPLPAPSNLFAILCDRLVILDDIVDRGRGPYDWSPLRIDRGKPGCSLGSWIALPWGAPQQLVMPGFHTAAEDGLKRRTTGNELFLSVTGLMATGTRTILLSRWRTGGQSSYDLVREFTQELPYSVAADAWQRSVQLTRASELDLEREPRVKDRRLDRAPNADHPFFWSGYMLVDTGMQPLPGEPNAVADAKPVVK